MFSRHFRHFRLSPVCSHFSMNKETQVDVRPLPDSLPYPNPLTLQLGLELLSLPLREQSRALNLGLFIQTKLLVNIDYQAVLRVSVGVLLHVQTAVLLRGKATVFSIGFVMLDICLHCYKLSLLILLLCRAEGFLSPPLHSPESRPRPTHLLWCLLFYRCENSLPRETSTAPPPSS